MFKSTKDFIILKRDQKFTPNRVALCLLTQGNYWVPSGLCQRVSEAFMKFICDDNLGRLAKWLRTLGYDTLFYPTISDQELIKKALEEERVILTRDNNLIQMKVVQNHLLIKSDQPLEQLKQVVQHFNLRRDEGKLFTRCSVCNTPLESIEKEKIKDRLYPYVYKTQEIFVYCSSCDKIYWPATHVEHMKQKLKKVFLE